MTLEELHRKFRIELDKLEISSVPSFLTEEIDYFLNTSIERFIKTRYSGLNVHKSGFQQSQKRSDDLRTVIKTDLISQSFSMYYGQTIYGIGSVVYFDGHLYKSKVLTNTDPLNDDSFWDKLNTEQNRFEFEYPADYWIGLGENCGISKINTITTPSISIMLVPIGTVDVIEATIENVSSKLNNSLSEHIFHNGRAKPIRLYSNGKIYLYTDSNYLISSYSIAYISKPTLLAWGINAGSAQITIMPDHTWDEIIVNAVRYALENISENRYQTYAQESQVVE